MNANTEHAVIHSQNERAQTDIDVVVNQGLAAALLDGIPAGIKIMRERGVPIEVCLRVMRSKNRRRDTDWK
jgi:intracellular sulfur oxidation DsrE/DsrF family protein